VTSLVFIFLISHVHFDRNTFIQIFSDFFINRLWTSNINTCNDQVVGFVVGFCSNFVCFSIDTKNSLFDNLVRLFLEFFEIYSRNHTSYFRSNVTASVTYKILNTEQFLLVFFIIFVHFKVPVIGKLKRELGMIRCFNCDNITHEIWS